MKDGWRKSRRLVLEGSLELELCAADRAGLVLWCNSSSESLRVPEVVVNTFFFSVLQQVKLFHALDVPRWGR